MWVFKTRPGQGASTEHKRAPTPGTACARIRAHRSHWHRTLPGTCSIPDTSQFYLEVLVQIEACAVSSLTPQDREGEEAGTTPKAVLLVLQFSNFMGQDQTVH